MVLRLYALVGIAAIAVLVAGVAARRCLIVYRVVGNSMEPALETGDVVFAARAPHPVGACRIAEAVSRGDVIAFSMPAVPRRTLLKRVVGIPGDTLEMRLGELFVNGRPFSKTQDYGRSDQHESGNPPGSWHFSYLLPCVPLSDYFPTASNWGPILVPAEACFVLGDHRRASGDSRSFGFVTRAELVAKAYAALSWKRGLRALTTSGHGTLPVARKKGQ